MGRGGSSMKGREKLAHLLFDDSTSACARDQGGLKRKWGEALKEVLCNSVDTRKK